MDLTIVIPALNERQKIVRDITAAAAFLRTSKLRGEIIVVADGSTDDTIAVAEALRGDVPELTILPYTARRGKGAAISRGVAAAEGIVTLFADAGLCVPYEDSALGLSMIRSGSVDIAHGNRGLPDTVIVKPQPLFRRLGSKYFRMFIHAIMGIPRDIRDTQCGFKLYRTDVAKELYADLFTPGFMFDIEIILRALRRNYRIGNFAVHWSNDEDTRYDPVRGTIENLWALVVIRSRVQFEPRRTLRTAAQPRTVTSASEAGRDLVTTGDAQPIGGAGLSAGSEARGS